MWSSLLAVVAPWPGIWGKQRELYTVSFIHPWRVAGRLLGEEAKVVGDDEGYHSVLC